MLPFIYEHLIIKHYKWTLNYTRSIDNYDFQIHLRLCLVSEAMDREVRMAIAGHPVGKSKKRAPTAEEVLTGAKGTRKGGGPVTRHIRQKFDPNQGKFV